MNGRLEHLVAQAPAQIERSVIAKNHGTRKVVSPVRGDGSAVGHTPTAWWARILRDPDARLDEIRGVVWLGAADPVAQFLALSAFISALIATGFAIQSALRHRTEEAAQQVESVLATACRARALDPESIGDPVGRQRRRAPGARARDHGIDQRGGSRRASASDRRVACVRAGALGFRRIGCGAVRSGPKVRGRGVGGPRSARLRRTHGAAAAAPRLGLRSLAAGARPQDAGALVAAALVAFRRRDRANA